MSFAATHTFRGRSGFTLIEVLLAATLFGVAITVLTYAFANTLIGLGTLQYDVDHQGDIRFVRNHILTLPDRTDLEAGGDVNTLGLGSATWRSEVEATDLPDLFRLRLTLEFNPPDREAFTHEETLLVLRPTWSKPEERSEALENFRRHVEDTRLGLN